MLRRVRTEEASRVRGQTSAVGPIQSFHLKMIWMNENLHIYSTCSVHFDNETTTGNNLATEMAFNSGGTFMREAFFFESFESVLLTVGAKTKTALKYYQGIREDTEEHSLPISSLGP